MSALIGLAAMLPVVIAVIAAYYFGKFVETSFDIHSTAVVGVLMVAFGVFVWWLLVQCALPALGTMLGWDKIPYTG